MRRFVQDKGRNEKPQVWEISCAQNAVHTMWGQLGGAMQQTTQTFEAVNVGKSNEKNPAQVAQEFMDRTIKKKNREGYVEVDLRTNKPLVEESASEIDFDKPLPLNLRFFKPQNQMGAGLAKKLKSGEAMALRKRNGMMHVLVYDEWLRFKMYGSNMLPGHKDEPKIPWLERYPEIVKSLDKFHVNIPPRTILLGELVTVSTAGYEDKEGLDVDDFNYVASIVKSKKDLALEKQVKDGALGFCIWDIAFWDGECWLQTKTSDERFEKVTELMLGADPDKGDWVYPYLRMPEMVYGWDEEELLAYARKKKWEGWVIVEREATYDDRAFNFHGKAERPKSVGKLKPMLEGDFIARWDPDKGIGSYGKGKKSGGVGAANMYLWDPVKKEEVFICEVGGGLTDAQVAEFADPSRYPKVWQVEFVEWTPKGALWHATFLRERDDKTPEECTIDQRPGAEEE